jgi:hypothetical protein
MTRTAEQFVELLQHMEGETLDFTSVGSEGL